MDILMDEIKGLNTWLPEALKKYENPKNLEELFENYRVEEVENYWSTNTRALKGLYDGAFIKDLVYKSNPFLKMILPSYKP
jgi:hypothetical protein